MTDTFLCSFHPKNKIMTIYHRKFSHNLETVEGEGEEDGAEENKKYPKTISTGNNLMRP